MSSSASGYPPPAHSVNMPEASPNSPKNRIDEDPVIVGRSTARAPPSATTSTTSHAPRTPFEDHTTSRQVPPNVAVRRGRVLQSSLQYPNSQQSPSADVNACRWLQRKALPPCPHIRKPPRLEDEHTTYHRHLLICIAPIPSPCLHIRTYRCPRRPRPRHAESTAAGSARRQ